MLPHLKPTPTCSPAFSLATFLEEVRCTSNHKGGHYPWRQLLSIYLGGSLELVASSLDAQIHFENLGN